MTVLIAGAGIAGLAAAVALGRRGVHVRVLEKRAALSEAGAGIQIGPNGIKALAALGLREAITPFTFQPERIAIFQARSGVRLTAIELADTATRRYGAPYVTLHRSDLQAVLLAAARTTAGVALDLDFELADIEHTSDSLTVRAADGRSASAAALIGADGLWSRVRQLRGGPPPVATGLAAYRTLIPRGRLSAPFDAPQVGLWIGAGAHVVHYPVRGGALLNVVVIVKNAQLSDDWDAPGRIADVTPHVARWSPGMRELLALAPEWRRWTLYDLPEPWQWGKGNTILVGDAAHPLLPFLAQGAVMALEDAVVLAANWAEGSGRPAAALASFERARLPRVSRVATTSRNNGTLYHQRGLIGAGRDLALQAMSPKRLLAGYDWLFGYDPGNAGA